MVRFATIFSAFVAIAAANSSPCDAAMRNQLSPEEHMLYVQQIHGANWRSLSIQQRCGRMEQVRSEWRTMSPTAREQLRQRLDARWNTLSATEKQRIEQRIAYRNTRKTESPGRRGEPRCGGLQNQPH
jgi:hypothetical protein